LDSNLSAKLKDVRCMVEDLLREISEVPHDHKSIKVEVSIKEEDTELNIPDDPILMPGEKDIEVNAEHDEDIGGLADDPLHVEQAMTGEDITPNVMSHLSREENSGVKTEFDSKILASDEGMGESTASEGFSCDKCKYIGNKLEDLYCHIESKHSLKNIETGCYKCKDCENVYRSRKSLITHMKRVHTGIEHKCSQCQYKTCAKSCLRSHMIKKHADGPTKCPQCKFVGYSIEELNHHVKIKHVLRNVAKDEDGLYRCKSCEYVTANPKNLFKHLQQHEGTVHNCTQCEYTSVSKANFQIHMIKVHIAKEYICDTCASAFKNNYNLKKHKERVHSKSDNPEGEISYCDQCTYSTPLAEYLRNHKRRKHGDKKYFCDQCPYSIKDQHELKKHVIRMHSKVE